MQNFAINSTRLAQTPVEYRELVGSDADWIVRTIEDLHEARKDSDKGLGKLSPEAYEEFAGRLEFLNGGVAGGYYKPLMELPLSDIFDVFGRFGMGPDLIASIHENACEGGECQYSFWSFCSSLCHIQVLPQ